METIEERAEEFADRHQETELMLRGLGSAYDYTRIYNSDICAYERGAKEQRDIDINKAYLWLKSRLQPYELEKFKSFMKN